ncbi:heme-binding protein [Novosphingobium flavum]|uniref:Heme-binding protein n=1 Tax=Novosphingobium flavum TaxID=1778672 RepID=A0A7X1KME0_9SPHN|nr:heme-binding protein [Novosphingobium flavum]MBC2666524.1 heme-binding protein [Novosphingobium flavum]
MRVINGAGAAALAAMASAALAQTPPPPMAPATVTPRDPLSIPGDNLPPPLANVVAPPPPPAAANAPRPAPPPQAPGPQMDVALAAIQAAIAKCAADGLKVGVAVTNQQGVIVAALRMDGASPNTVFNGLRKSLVALEFGVPSSEVQTRLRAGDFATLARIKPNMFAFAGAVPLVSKGQVIGAIGASGAMSRQDEACAAAGAAAVASRI